MISAKHEKQNMTSNFAMGALCPFSCLSWNVRDWVLWSCHFGHLYNFFEGWYSKYLTTSIMRAPTSGVRLWTPSTATCRSWHWSHWGLVSVNKMCFSFGCFYFAFSVCCFISELPPGVSSGVWFTCTETAEWTALGHETICDFTGTFPLLCSFHFPPAVRTMLVWTSL